MELHHQPPHPTTSTSAAAADHRSSAKPGVGYQPPEGAWKGGVFDCANQLAPSCAIATCLPCLGLALLSQRLGWSGDARPCPCQRAFLPPDTPGSAQRHYQRTMLRFVSATIVVAFWLLAMLGDQFATKHPGNGRLQWYDYLLIAAVVLFTLEFIMFIARLRARARARLQLPPFCGGMAGHEDRDPLTGRRMAFCGDACVSLVCPLLVLAQLLRHLFDFRGRFDPRWPLRDVDAETLV